MNFSHLLSEQRNEDRCLCYHRNMLCESIYDECSSGMGSGASKNKSSDKAQRYGTGNAFHAPPAHTRPPPYGWDQNVIHGGQSPNANPYMGNQQPPVYPQQTHTTPPTHAPNTPNKAQDQHTPDPKGTESQDGKQQPNPPGPEQYEWSYDRDRIYMLVLSADEFLGRMDETDHRIHTISKASERDIHRKTIQDLLGLRGHLQDELLRIEQMLAKDDPKLKCLNFLADNFPHVVSKLKELRQKEQIVKAKVVQAELPPSGPQADGTQGTSSDTQSGSGDKSTLTEEDLKHKHDQEEKQVAQNYADRILTKSEVTHEDVDNLLQDHALSMQALRKRQEEERERVQNSIKKQMKKRSYTAGEHEEGDSPSSSQASTPRHKGKKDDFLNSEEETSDSEDEASDTEVLTDTMWTKMKTLPHRMTAENLKDMVESFTQVQQEEKKLIRRSTRSTLPAIKEVQTPRNMVSVGVDVNANKTTASTVSMGTDPDHSKQTVTMGTSPDTNNTASMATGTNDEDDQQVQALLREDENFVKNFLSENMDGMSPQDYTRFMEDYLKDRERIRKLKAYEKQQLKEKLKQKLGNKRPGSAGYKRPGSAGSNYTNYSDDFEPDKSEENKKMSSDEESLQTPETHHIDSEETEELKKLKEEFYSTLSRKRREGVSESEMQRLLEEYRRKQLQIIKDKESERNKHQDNMKAKLQERLRQKQENEETSPEATEDDDSTFFEKMQRMQMNGELSKDEFTEMLKSYMDKKKQANRKKRNLRNTENNKKAASEIVHKFNKDKQEVHGIRKAEKEKMDSKLKQRLKAKRNKQLEQSYGESDNSFNTSSQQDSSFNDTWQNDRRHYIETFKDDSPPADEDYEF